MTLIGIVPGATVEGCLKPGRVGVCVIARPNTERNIIADGVSLVKNYRSQFEKIIRSDSYEELVQRLRDRTVVDGKKEKR